MATTEQWKDDLASRISSILATNAAQIARIEALEAQAAHKPAQAEQAEQGAMPLWRRMDQAFYDNGGQDHDDWVAVMDAVADWLAAGHPTHATAANALRAEARCTREGRRG